MRRVYLSFLGIGQKRPDGTYGYSEARYALGTEPSSPTEFVQVAEMELLGPSSFDEAIIVVTEKSRDLHFHRLRSRLEELGACRVGSVLVGEDMSAEGQWGWFQEILGRIREGDRLTVDLTHGYRAIPIVFSAALNFLQKARGVVVEGVYYGAYDRDRELAPIVDLKDFYVIGEWAEGASRLVEDADARKLAALAERTPDFQVGELNDPDLVRRLEDLTDKIRNVDVHNVAGAAAEVLGLVGEKSEKASEAGRLLLDLLGEKYASLAWKGSPSRRYDKGYFAVQCSLTRMLLEHKLYMQAFTVMRELIGSIGLIENEKANPYTAKGRQQRAKAEVFINMLQFPEAEWKFGEGQRLLVEKVRPFYEKLKKCGVKTVLRSFLPELIRYRNGFDHAWTGVKGAPEDVREQGDRFYRELEKVFSVLESEGVLL